MVNINDAVLVEYKYQKKSFEILVDCDLAMEFKKGKGVSVKDILAVEKIFSDSKKGQEASPTELKTIFGTDDVFEVAGKIIKKGDVHVTTDYKNRAMEEKKKRIINIIHRNGVDPRTHAPHPVTRIEAAMEEAKIHIDEYKPAEEQVHSILSKLKPIIPIKFEIKEIELTIPAKHAGKTVPLLKSLGKITKEQWQNDGSYYAVIDIPGGLEEEFLNKVNSTTHGDNEINIIRKK